MTQPVVSVITRTKDRPLTLRRAAASVLGQTWSAIEWVVVNDGGDTACVDEIVDPLRDRFSAIRVCHRPESGGVAVAANTGLSASSGKYLCLHDDDDSWEPRFLETCVGFLEDPERPGMTRAVTTRVTHVFETLETDRIVEHGRRLSRRHADESAVTLFQMAAGNFIPPISFVYERAIHDQVGPYRDDLNVLEDWDFYLRLLSEYDVGVIEEPLANYHLRTSARGAYANTWTPTDDRHAATRARLLNEWLRSDLRNGRIGLGTLVALARSVESIARPARRARQLAERVSSRFRS